MLCLLVAAIIRDIWYLHLVTRPGELLSVPMGDSTVYLQLARELATGGSAAHAPFYWSPLYSLFLALWSGNASSLIIVPQMLAGLGILWFVFLIARRAGSTRAGFLAALCLALYAPFLMFQTKLLPVIFAALFAVIAVWLSLRAIAVASSSNLRNLRIDWFLAGISFGLSALLMPQLLLAPFLLGSAMLVNHGLRRPAAILALAAGVILAVAPVTIRNAVTGHDFVPVSSSAGFNLHLSWNPGATGLIGWPPEMLEFRKDGKAMIGVSEQQEFQRLYAEQQTGHSLSPSQVSAFWTRRSLNFIFGRPAKATALLLRKFWLTLTNFEFANSYYPELERRLAPPLRTAFLPWALVLGLGLAGMILTWSRRRALLPVYVLPAAIPLSLLIFFVNSRYRLPAIPMLCVLAGLGIDAALTRGRRAWVTLLAVAVPLSLLSGVVLRLAFAETIRFDEGFGWRNLNVNAQRLGRYDLAFDLLERAARLTQQSPRNARTAAQYDDLAQSLAGLGNTLVDRREPALARRAFDRAIELNPRFGPAWLMRGVAELDAGEPAAALRDAEQTLRLAPEFVNALVLKSRSLLALGNRAAAESTARVAARLDPEEPMVAQLLGELNLAP